MNKIEIYCFQAIEWRQVPRDESHLPAGQKNGTPLHIRRTQLPIVVPIRIARIRDRLAVRGGRKGGARHIA